MCQAEQLLSGVNQGQAEAASTSEDKENQCDRRTDRSSHPTPHN